MAKDVDNVLLEIIQDKGGYDERDAKNYVRNLRKEKRYQRDVY
jgi:sulfite reductase (NADPH) flavoprotein alpha-component